MRINIYKFPPHTACHAVNTITMGLHLSEDPFLCSSSPPAGQAPPPLRLLVLLKRICYLSVFPTWLWAHWSRDSLIPFWLSRVCHGVGFQTVFTKQGSECYIRGAVRVQGLECLLRCMGNSGGHQKRWTWTTDKAQAWNPKMGFQQIFCARSHFWRWAS